MRMFQKKLCLAANGIHKYTAIVLAVLLPVIACMMLAAFLKVYEMPRDLLPAALPNFCETMTLLMFSLMLTFGGACLMEIALRYECRNRDI